MPTTTLTTGTDQDRFTGESLRRTRPKTYSKVVQLLASNRSINEISHTCKVSEHTVKAVAARNSIEIAERKKELAVLMADMCEDSLEQARSRLKQASFTQAMVGAGISAERLVALTQAGPEVAVAIQINQSQDDVKISAALAKLKPPVEL